MILNNGRLGDRLVDLRIEDGRVVEIGQIADRGTDLEGRWIVPGLWDQHVHFSQFAMFQQRVDLGDAASAAEAAAIIARSPRPPIGLALVGVGFRDGLWPDAPTTALLDAAVSDVPAVLISADLHCCWLNSRALVHFAVTGQPEGLLREDDCFAVVRALDDVPLAVLDEWVAEAGREAASRGVVGIVDFEMNWGFDNWRRRMEQGFDSLRVRAGVYPQYLDRAIAAGLRTGAQLGGLLGVGPFKIITDGSLNTRTAYCTDPYPGDGDNRGILTVQPDELVDWLRRATDAGLTPAVHAIGDGANHAALDAFETVGCIGRIEHAQLLSDGDVERFAALGITASVQPEHAMDDRDVAERYWSGRTERTFPFRDLIDAGVTLALGSDAPVSPLDPWVAIAAAVGRSRGGREPWHPEQRITAAEALAASVEGPVRVGGPADLVITELDPLAVSPDELRRMPVAATVLAGQFTYQLR
jgi:predicted amidohydrolase YtcJ